MIVHISRRLVAAGAVILLAAGTAHAQYNGCGELASPGQYGPFDYRRVPVDSKNLVETAHFTAPVEQLKAGATSYLGADLDYTLRAIPNHPRALLAMSRYSLRQKTNRVAGARYTTECYFDRGMRMAPDDPMPHVLFANYLKQVGKAADAKKQLGEAEGLRRDPRSPDLDYNLGLLWFELGETDKAQAAAKRAYALGAPLPGLRNMLKAKGRALD